MIRRCFFTVTVVANLAASARAWAAGGSDAAAADALFQHAKEAMGHGDFATACAQFAESERLDPAPGTLLNLAECEERSGKLAAALAHLQEAHDRLPPGDYRTGFADQRMAALSPRVPRLTFRVVGAPVAGLLVLRDDEPLALVSQGVAIPVDPGPHVLIVRAAGRTDARTELTMSEGEARSVDLSVGQPLPAASVDSPAARRGSAQQTWGLITAGVGAVGVGIGTVFGLVSKGTYDSALAQHCGGNPSKCDAPGVQAGRTAHDEAQGSTLAFVAGGVLLAAGAAIYLTAPKHGALRVAPSIGHAGFEIGGLW